ncbi:MAG TPA: hypothetical protein VG253_28855 [Streptosporangiaceae bacterium]|nr:hypothetical protein [Streptosporangiaceae bacterium]
MWAIAAAVTFLCVPAAPASLFGVAQYAHVATWMSWGVVTMVRVRSLAPPQAGQELLRSGLGQDATLNTIGDA